MCAEVFADIAASKSCYDSRLSEAEIIRLERAMQITRWSADRWRKKAQDFKPRAYVERFTRAHPEKLGTRDYQEAMRAHWRADAFNRAMRLLRSILYGTLERYTI